MDKRNEALTEATRIQRYTEPQKWGAAIEAIKDDEVQAIAREYLRGMYRRLKVVEQMRKEAAQNELHARRNPRR